MASTHDIVAIRSTREVLLIGPRLSLNAVPKSELLGEAELRSYLADAFSDPGDHAQLRGMLARWGIDTRRLVQISNGALAAWIAGLVGTGRLRAVVARDPGAHLAARPGPVLVTAPIAAALTAAREVKATRTAGPVRERSQVFAAVKSATVDRALLVTVSQTKSPVATPSPKPATGSQFMQAAPALDVGRLGLEERLTLVLARTVESDRLSAAAKAELQALLDPEAIAITIGVLAFWAGSHLTPFGYIADAVMLGVGVFFAGRAVLEGGKKLAQFLGLTLSAKTEADLDAAADMLAAALALLSVKLFAKLLSRGASGLNNAGKAKKAKAEPPRPRNPEPRTTARSGTDKETAAPTKPPPKPKNADQRLGELKSQGHGPQRHEGDVTEQQLVDRATKGHDPLTGSTTDGVHGGTHNYGRHATKVNSPEAYVKAEEKLKASDEFKQEAAKATAEGRDRIVVKDQKLEDIYGSDYRDQVAGKTRLGSKNNPTGTTNTDFTDGSMKGVYDRDASGNWNLTTMYPEPKG